MLLQFPTYKEGVGERGRKQEGGGGKLRGRGGHQKYP
jgi:hypothetical protein